jgi:sporulation protein YlmC with PRC-barrel domain
MSYADRDRYGMYKNSTSAGPGPSLMGADTLVGDSVVNAMDEDLGEIKEIMLDMNTGQVAYAVLAFGGFLGMGEKLFAVPWQALHLDTVNKRFVLNVDKDRLKTAPGFNPDAWPDMGDISWANQIHSFYGTDPSRASAPTMGPGSSMAGMAGGAGASTGVGAGAAGMGSGSAGSTGGAGTASGMGAGSSSSTGSAGSGMGGSTSTGTGGTSGSGLGAGAAGSTGSSAGSAGSTGTVSSAGISSGSGSSTTGSSSAGMGTGSGLGGSSGAGTGAGSDLGSSSSGKKSDTTGGV